MVKIWVDDVRQPPDGWIHIRSVNELIEFIKNDWNSRKSEIQIISFDHDSGDYHSMGGDYINALNWMEEECFNRIQNSEYFHIPNMVTHSANPVGCRNMNIIIDRINNMSNKYNKKG